MKGSPSIPALSTLSKNDTYLNQRLKDLSITPKINKHLISTENKNIKGRVTETVIPFFEADEHGNIVINYFNLQGNRYSWKKENAKWPIHYQRKRLFKTKDDQKYSQEKGSGQFPFFTPGILEKYKLAKLPVETKGRLKGKRQGQIDTLFVVEGEFKAFKGDMVGIDIIGIPSIHGFYNGDVRGKLHEDIQDLIITCGVVKIVFLVDADLLSLRWEEKKDLAKRPESFFAAVKLFRESLELLIDDEKIPLHNVYVMHLQIKYMNDAKGLDDLLSKYPAITEDIKKDLLQFQFAKTYFSGKIINDSNKDMANFRKYLGLYDEQEFYKIYGDFIGAHEFLYKNKRFEYNPDKKEVEFVRHEDADKYMRIGPDWVKIVRKQNEYGHLVEEMKPWSIAEINRDYKVGKNSDFFISQLSRYDDFCNEPAWDGTYKRFHHGCYNLCSPLKWDPEPGTFVNTYKFLKHIFGGQAELQLDPETGKLIQENAILGDQFSVALDWLSILFRYPKQMLPVPILVSKENGTGKSTFLKWLNMIFGVNMVILGNDQFKMKFNGHYITKYLIAIDEGFLDVDKKAEKERLKQLVTANTVYLENKGMNVTKVPYYGKLLISSNDADRVMKIDEGESRWFVVKVPVIPNKEVKGQILLDCGRKLINGKPIDPLLSYQVADIDPDLELKMMMEIPAMIHYLRERNIFHPRTGRLWFDPEHFMTDQFRVIVDATKNRIDRVFEDWIKEQFYTYRLPVLKYSIGYLTEKFNDYRNNKYKIDTLDLRTFFKNRNIEHDKKPQRFRYPEALDIPEDGSLRETKIMMCDAKPTHPYIFKIEEWISEEDLKTLLPLTDPTKLVLLPAGQKIPKPQESLAF